MGALATEYRATASYHRFATTFQKNIPERALLRLERDDSVDFAMALVCSIGSAGEHRPKVVYSQASLLVVAAGRDTPDTRAKVQMRQGRRSTSAISACTVTYVSAIEGPGDRCPMLRSYKPHNHAAT